MKRIKILLLLLFLATGFSMNAMSLESGNSSNYEGRKDNDHKDRGRDRDKGCPPVGVPLDGGLLTVLGVGGVAYYVARKKGKKPES